MNHALLVIDLIEDYFDASLWPASILPQKRSALASATAELVRICRTRRVPVIWVTQEFRPDFSDAFPHAKRAGVAYALAGTPGAQIISELGAAPGEAVMTKARFSAFYGTRLDSLLADLSVSGVILAGVTTAWCVRSTAVDAYQRDLDVILASDCVAAFDDKAHEDSLAAMDGYIARCVRTGEMADYLDSHAGPGHAARR